MLLAMRISSYGCTWGVWRELKKLELQLLRIFRVLQTSRVHTESFICEFLFVSVEILKCKICIYQITGVPLFLDFVSFFSVSLQQQIARDAHRLVSTYSITSRNMLWSCRCHFEINRKPAQTDKFSGHISLPGILTSALACSQTLYFLFNPSSAGDN